MSILIIIIFTKSKKKKFQPTLIGLESRFEDLTNQNKKKNRYNNNKIYRAILRGNKEYA